MQSQSKLFFLSSSIVLCFYAVGVGDQIDSGWVVFAGLLITGFQILYLFLSPTE